MWSLDGTIENKHTVGGYPVVFRLIVIRAGVIFSLEMILAKLVLAVCASKREKINKVAGIMRALGADSKKSIVSFLNIGRGHENECM